MTWGLNMSVKIKLKKLFIDEGIKIKKVAELLSDKRNEHVLSNGLSQKINRSTMKFDEVEEIVELLGYEIVFQKKKP